MKSILTLAAGLSILAGVARAQLPSLPGLPELPGAPKAPRSSGSMYQPVQPKPYAPPRLPSVYADGPFSPAGEARRERRANAPPAGGPFSPEAEAKRQQEAARRFHPF